MTNKGGVEIDNYLSAAIATENDIEQSIELKKSFNQLARELSDNQTRLITARIQFRGGRSD